jgi:hypothetical protein
MKNEEIGKCSKHPPLLRLGLFAKRLCPAVQHSGWFTGRDPISGGMWRGEGV